MKKPFEKILIANRGEIAIRVIRTCRELGVRTVAVFSEADRQALHVRLADEAVCIGPPPAAQSYLASEKILDAARATSSQAIHPGYGFLSENAGFSRACREAGLVFIGPSPESIERMGDKVAARRAMTEAGVPVVPGVQNSIEDDGELEKAAAQIGFPVMIKAVGGGGGKGIRIVREPKDLLSAARLARSEAGKSFQDSRIYLEKVVENPHHVEIQVLGDAHGGAIHLGERECSVQRRHQKLIEETPSPLIDEKTRQAMGEAAVRAVQSLGYLGAGTMEFLVNEDLDFFFLEMNTRLQVEHPVTEMVTGVDLVAEQLYIAAGEPLRLKQEDIRFTGHAIEARINAEDPDTFLPATGTIQSVEIPSGPGVRFDGAVYAGMEVGLFYDPMLAKLIVWGADRPSALRRLRSALSELSLPGVKTSAETIRLVLEHPRFQSGKYDTHFLESEIENLRGSAPVIESEELAAIAAVLADLEKRRSHLKTTGDGGTSTGSAWKIAGRMAQLRRGM
ncbi:MAG: acetyl-CoA carboxylase biotin carboxylase subunit [Planctomycetota bacterium]